QVPLAELYKYIITLRSITGGRGEYTMALSHYEEVPAHVSELIIKDAAGTMEEEED
ncbi:MAG: hypothetical protein HY766_10920, partial [candidate division NC10 bacterium]|nr:hypothetical protein [candidate division NC10 bacterium]